MASFYTGGDIDGRGRHWKGREGRNDTQPLHNSQAGFRQRYSWLRPSNSKQQSKPQGEAEQAPSAFSRGTADPQGASEQVDKLHHAFLLGRQSSRPLAGYDMVIANLVSGQRLALKK